MEDTREADPAYPHRIVNIHPALLPGYGGKGMYGHHVHEAVIAAGEKESGITIHYVDELYDHGQAIFQERVVVDPDDTPATLAAKVQQLEHRHFARVIEEVVNRQSRITRIICQIIVKNAANPANMSGFGSNITKIKRLVFLYAPAFTAYRAILISRCRRSRPGTGHRARHGI